MDEKVLSSNNYLKHKSFLAMNIARVFSIVNMFLLFFNKYLLNFGVSARTELSCYRDVNFKIVYSFL